MTLHLSLYILYLLHNTGHLKSVANALWSEGAFGTLLIRANFCVNLALKFDNSDDKFTLISTSSSGARNIGSL